VPWWALAGRRAGANLTCLGRVGFGLFYVVVDVGTAAADD
jgi:hypothetical protein